MGLPKVHVSGKNPTSGNSWKELFTAPPEALACSINTPASYNLGQTAVEKIVCLDSIFLDIVAVPIRPSPRSPESNVVVYSKENLIPGRL